MMNLTKLQSDLIKSFDRVSHLCEGLAAVSWLPGEGQTFDTTKRAADDETRPLAVILEVTEGGGLTLSVAISRPYKGKLCFVTHGKWDFRAPIIAGGREAQLNLNKPKHRLNAKRACDALHKMLDYGFAAKRGEAPELEKPRFPVVIELPNGRFVEDYAPVLGAQDRNPLGNVSSIVVRLPNPAAKILARHGLESAEQAEKDPALFEALASEVRACVPDMDLSEEAVCEALLDPAAPVPVMVDIKTALHTMPATAADSLRRQVSRRVASEATDSELLVAAANPDRPIMLSRLSAVQLCDIADWQDLPEPYTGALLAPVLWSPQSKFAAIEAM
jgi:hypothetical protein